MLTMVLPRQLSSMPRARLLRIVLPIIRTSGCSMIAAIALMPAISDAECAPPLAASTDLHVSHSHAPIQSF